MDLGGLIAGAIKGGADAYGQVAKTEYDSQKKLDLTRELNEMEVLKDQRIKDLDLARNRDEEKRKLSPEYLQSLATADRTRGELAAGNRVALAPKTAEADKAEYDAGKPLADTKSADATRRKITETTTLAGDKKYLSGVAALDTAEAAGERSVAGIRAAAEGGRKLDPRITARINVIDDELKQISGAITKAQAEGMWDEKGENARALRARQRQLQNQMLELLDMGGTGGGGGANDTLRSLLFGKDGPAPAANPAPAPAPAPKPEAKKEDKANVTDPNSPAGKFQARINAGNDQRESTRAARMRETQTSFDADLGRLEPIDLVGKYNDMRGMLTREQLLKLKTEERKL
jgi:hypothetical protein